MSTSSSTPTAANATTDILYQLYYQQGNVLSAQPFARLVRKKYPNITIKTITDWVKNQEAAQVSHRVAKPTKFNTVLGYVPNENWQLDIGVMKNYEINRYKYFLVI